MGFAHEAGDLSIPALGPAAQAQWAFDEPLEVVAGKVDARQVALAAVFEREQNLAAIGAEAGRIDVAVEAFGQHPRRAARGR